jgi:5-methylcytosine-specific restriction endonuclease McrA
MSEYITCSRCGIVRRGHICPHKTYRKRERNSKADKFRSGNLWTAKSIEIRTRDRYLCRVCEANLYNTIRQYNSEGLEVHHIIPLAEDYNKRLDNDNLITLCNYHHKLAEDGHIPRDILQEMVREK